MEYFVGPPASCVELSGVTREAGAGDYPCVADCGEDGAIQDAVSDEAGCEGAAEAAVVVLYLFAFLTGGAG